MIDLWTTLVPLIVAGIVVPVQLVITLMLVRTSLRAAAAWVAGMALTRLVQGVVFGLVLTPGNGDPASASELGIVASSLLLVLAVLLYVTALRQLLKAEDEDAPPAKWMERVGSMTPLVALGAGAGYMAVAAKFWVFTLGAIAAIAEAELTASAAALTFVLFVVLSQAGNLAILTIAGVFPVRAAGVLDALTEWLRRNNRVIKIVIGVVFGTWFLLKALSGFGLL